MTKSINEMKASIMRIYDEYRNYVTEELDDCLAIQKNNDTTYYDVLETISDLSNGSLCVLNHLYINEGQEETFEQKFLRRNKHLENVDGFRALRFLRPRTAGRHCIIITLWENRQAFYHWQNSTEYKHIHKHRGISKGVDVKIINRELSCNIRIESAGMVQPEISTPNHLKVLECYVMSKCNVEDFDIQPYLIENSVEIGV